MSIKIFSWNCRGAGHEEFIRSLRFYLTNYKPDIVIIVEPRISGITVDRVINEIGLRGRIIVEARGFAGGIWLLWNLTDLDVTEAERSEQFIHAKVKLSDGRSCMITAVYPKPTSRVILWDDLKALSSGIILPWELIGDFNSILAANEKRGGASFCPARAVSFRNCIDQCGLIGACFEELLVRDWIGA
ncbi:hypothetical protein LINPERHAP1_LOCUS31793 [Linum perenne]